ncbi:MAG: hypothetical protein IJH92_05955 [Mogibacterium sp.]|nr:hypothetical protein [Mogibacterium sp.]
MDYQVNGITILNNDEVRMLLVAAGVERWYGLDLSEGKDDEMDESYLNRILASLYRKQLVDWNDGRAHIAEPYKPAFRTLRDAGICILIENGHSGRVRACYCSGGNVVSVERRTASGHEIELCVQTVSEWLTEMQSPGIMPETAGEPEEGPLSAPEPEPYVTFELRSVPDGSLLQSMAIREQGLYAMMEMSEGGAVRSELYSREKAVKILKEWSGGIA